MEAYNTGCESSITLLLTLFNLFHKLFDVNNFLTSIRVFTQFMKYKKKLELN